MSCAFISRSISDFIRRLSLVFVLHKHSFYNYLKDGYHYCDYGLCYPIVEVSYFRNYFSIFNLRVTLDTSITYRQYNKKKIIPYQETAIMEVKSDNLDNLNYIEEKIHFPKTRFSKYCNAFERI